MVAVIAWLEAVVRAIPLPLLEMWGRVSYLVGWALAICAFGGFTFRVGDRWGLGRARQTWNEEAFLSVPFTFILIIASGYLGSFVVLVPGAQTFESLKDLAVLLSVVLFGRPALIIVPFAYGLSDLIEGVPPDFILSWLPGYFINPACFWLAYQLIGRNPDFRLPRTWGRYVLFVLLFTAIEPVLWGYICSAQFTAEISYRAITPALFFTTAITWIIAPVAMLGAWPLVRRVGLFWAEIPGHVRELPLRGDKAVWEAGRQQPIERSAVVEQRVPIRMFILAPFVALLLVMVTATAYVSLRSAGRDATRLASRLHQETSENLKFRLDDYLARAGGDPAQLPTAGIGEMLHGLSFASDGRVLIVERAGGTVASSVTGSDAVADAAVEALHGVVGSLASIHEPVEFSFDHITPSPARETWLAQATPYPDEAGRWILVTAMPEAVYLAGVREGNSRAAMVFALSLILCLALAAVLASTVTAPLRRLSMATRAIASGDLEQRVPGSRLEEVGVLAESFNDMAEQMRGAFDRVLREVETRKRRERQLEDSESRARMSENRLHVAVRAGQLGIWDWDVERNQLVWDDSMYRLYGVERNAFTGPTETWSRCLVPDDLTRAMADVDAALRGEREFTSEFRIRRDDGAVRFIRAVGQTFRQDDGRPVRMVGINWDVTDRQEAEQERERLVHDLRERVKELRLLHAAARLLQRDRPFTRALLEELVVLLPAAWQYPECCEARIVHGDVEVLTPGWRETPWRQSTAFATEQGDGLIEVAYLDARPAEAEGPFLAEERALLESLADMLVGYLELRRHQEELETLVASRTRELQIAKEAAETANRAKSAFLTNMSHEIRTPMNAILGYAQLLSRDEALGDAQKQKLEVIRSSGDHLLTLINDVLEMSRIEAGRATLVVAPFDLRALIHDVDLMFSPLATARGLRLLVELDDRLPSAVTGDAGKVRQVLINLLSNAVKFTDAGSIWIRTSSSPAGDGMHVVSIAVADTGLGIEPESMGRIFSAFDQAASGVLKGGTGLGLAISRHFARLMDGDLTVQSTMRQGTTFTFSFPAGAAGIADLPLPESPRIPRAIEAGTTRRRILIVDDVPTNRRLLEDLVSGVGFETRTAASGEEAIDAVEAWRPDLVLMDLRMPGIGGLEAARRLRAQGSKTVIVAVTASGLAEAEAEVLAAGLDAFVRKPYLEAVLLEKIGQLLQIRYEYAPPADRVAVVVHHALPSPVALPAAMFSNVPVALRAELLAAALQGRAGLLEHLATRVSEYSEPAAAQVRALAGEFRYDVLVEALKPAEPQ